MATATAVKLPGVTDAGKAPKKKKKIQLSRKKLIALLVVLALIAGAGYFFLRPADAAHEPEPKGPVLKLESITLNLEDGHFLKLGMALQFSAEAAGEEEAPDGAQALDLAIDQLSNRKLAELNSTAARNIAKDRLVRAISKAYHGEVTDVYFTEFVMQ